MKSTSSRLHTPTLTTVCGVGRHGLLLRARNTHGAPSLFFLLFRLNRGSPFDSLFPLGRNMRELMDSLYRQYLCNAKRQKNKANVMSNYLIWSKVKENDEETSSGWRDWACGWTNGSIHAHYTTKGWKNADGKMSLPLSALPVARWHTHTHTTSPFFPLHIPPPLLLNSSARKIQSFSSSSSVRRPFAPSTLERLCDTFCRKCFRSISNYCEYW